MKILILGGTQFIGPQLVKSLHDKDAEIYLFHRGKTHYPFPFPVRHVYGERHELGQYRKEFLKIAPDVVIDMFAYTQKDGDDLVNTFKDIVPHIIMISSADVYRAFDRLLNNIEGDIELGLLKEDALLREKFHPLRSRSQEKGDFFDLYDKLLIENRLRHETGVNWTILRLPMVYGPGDYSRIWGYLKRIDENRPILLDEQKADWRICRGYVGDVAEAIALAAFHHPGKRVYNIAECNAMSEREWINAIAHFANKTPRMVLMAQSQLPAHLKEPLCWQQHLQLDTSLIRAELGYEERGFGAGMKNAIHWIRSNNCTDINLIQSINYFEEDEVLKAL